MRKIGWLILFISVLLDVNNLLFGQIEQTPLQKAYSKKILDRSKNQKNTEGKSNILAKQPVFSPDGNKIAFLSNKEQATIKGKEGWYSHLFELYTVNTDGSNLKKIPSASDVFYFINCFCWSPQGTKIAFAASKISVEKRDYLGVDIFIVNAD